MVCFSYCVGELEWVFIITLYHWLKKLTRRLFHPIRSKFETNRMSGVCRVSRQIHLLTLIFDWFTVLSEPFMISGWSDKFGLVLRH